VHRSVSASTSTKFVNHQMVRSKLQNHSKKSNQLAQACTAQLLDLSYVTPPAIFPAPSMSTESETPGNSFVSQKSVRITVLYPYMYCSFTCWFVV